MKNFDYRRAASLDEAIAAAALPGAAILAGGTNLLDLMKMNIARPDILVDVSRIAELSGIEWRADGGVRIGALVRNSDLAYDARFATSFPLVAEALLSGASAQLRNVATVGGNVMQKTRCAYYGDVASACNRRNPRSGCDALGGLNRLHAVLGWSSHCIATHPSDFCVALSALDAVVELAGPAGRRDVALNEFFHLPGDHPERETQLLPGELIVAVRLSAEASAFARNARYLKLRERTSYAFAVVSAAAALVTENGSIQQARLCLGAVAAKPWRAYEAEEMLIGKPANAENFAQAAEIALAEAKPSGENAFKIELARRILIRALEAAHLGTPAEMPALPGSVFSTQTGNAQQMGNAHVA